MYRNAQASGALGRMTWQDFRKNNCGTNPTVIASVAAPPHERVSWRRETAERGRAVVWWPDRTTQHDRPDRLAPRDVPSRTNVKPTVGGLLPRGFSRPGLRRLPRRSYRNRRGDGTWNSSPFISG